MHRAHELSSQVPVAVTGALEAEDRRWGPRRRSTWTMLSSRKSKLAWRKRANEQLLKPAHFARPIRRKKNVRREGGGPLTGGTARKGADERAFQVSRLPRNRRSDSQKFGEPRRSDAHFAVGYLARRVYL